MNKDDSENPLEEMRMLVAKARMSTEQDIEYIGIRSVLYRAAFDALVNQKFSDDQALRLIIARGPLLL